MQLQHRTEQRRSEPNETLNARWCWGGGGVPFFVFTVFAFISRDSVGLTTEIQLIYGSGDFTHLSLCGKGVPRQVKQGTDLSDFSL